jgi:hypothetical protein
MRGRRIALSVLVLLCCCSCQEKREVKNNKGVVGALAVPNPPSRWLIQITADANGRCVQMVSQNGGAAAQVDTWVEVKDKDYVQWASTNASGANKAIFFSPTGTPDYPGSPVYSKTGDLVRSLAVPSAALQNMAKLTTAEVPDFYFSYTQVLVPDAQGKLTPCSYPDPVQGMGVHVTQ